MHTFFFLFSSFGFLSFVFFLGCIGAGVAFAHERWSSSVTRILQLRREQKRLQQELALCHRATEQTPPKRNASRMTAPSTPSRLSSIEPDVSTSRERPSASLRSARTASSPSIDRSQPSSATDRSQPSSSSHRRPSLREDRQLGLVFYLAPSDPDPLDQLPSISSAQVRELNMLGVYKFEQIAKWSEANVRSFALLMGLSPEDITEMDWVHQAKVLHGETHGSKMFLAS